MKVTIPAEARELFLYECDTARLMADWKRCYSEALDRALESAVVEDGPSGTEANVCSDISERQRVGIKKYGITVANNPLKLEEWLQHAYEECLDQAVYLKRAMNEMKENKNP